MIRFAAAVLSASLAGCATHRSAGEGPSAASPHATLAASTPGVARGATPEAGKPDLAEVRSLEKTLRNLLLQNLPDPIVQSARGWGQQKEGVIGVNFEKDGPRLRSESIRGMRNDGVWRRVAVRAVDPEKTLALGIADPAFPEPGRATFTAMLGVDCAIRFEQQLWRNGTRLYSGETRGRCRAAAALKCEVVSRTETKPGSLLPDFVVRVRVTDAQLFYDDLVIEHTAGVGGDAAKLLGQAVIDAVKQAKPDLERDLLKKANAAIVKAADTKEVRVSLDSFLKGGPMVGRKK
ncbi:MAG: hypothetical protein JWO38_5423 [Gemmataceae bacterium]|nr:hypothetical protein [Gemmataceae bacterium]